MCLCMYTYIISCYVFICIFVCVCIYVCVYVYLFFYTNSGRLSIFIIQPGNHSTVLPLICFYGIILPYCVGEPYFILPALYY